MATKKITLTELRNIVKQIIKEENNNEKKFVLAIDDDSVRYFITKGKNDMYIVIEEMTNELYEMKPEHAKKIFRVVGDATDLENSKLNKLIN